MNTENWQRLTLLLKERGGMTQIEIGRAVGLPQSTVHALQKGSRGEVKYSVGTKLLALYEEKLGEKYEPIAS